MEELFHVSTFIFNTDGHIVVIDLCLENMETITKKNPENPKIPISQILTALRAANLSLVILAVLYYWGSQLIIKKTQKEKDFRFSVIKWIAKKTTKRIAIENWNLPTKKKTQTVTTR